jgi:multiple sugar transport system substrate-binding protein
MTKNRRRASTLVVALGAAISLVACGSDDGGGSSEEGGATSLQVLIASSGDAETNAVKEAAAAWAEETGNEVEVLPAQDINQQLGQAFAGGNPPDVFYVDAARFGDYAEQGSLFPYGDQIEDADDFYEPLRETFTYEGQLYCAPKDFSTLGLIINTAAWTAAGLTDADVPTDWNTLQSVAQKLTTGSQKGLVIGDTNDRVGAFFVQNGGWILNEDGTEVTADSSENVEALTYVKGLLDSGVAAYPKEVDAGWGGEAFGLGKAAMTIEGNWIKGAIKNDYPDVQYLVAPLPEGSAGQGTLLFTQCYGIAAQSENQAAAVELVNYLTSAETQLANADAFGVMPSRQSVEADYVAKYPEDAAFVAGGEYGQGPVNQPGFDAVMSDYNSQLAELKTKEPQAILAQLQTNAEAALGG